MDERGGVDELEDDGEIEVAGVDLAGGAAGQEGERGAEALAAALAGVGDVRLDGGIEGTRLLRDALLDAVKLGVDEIEGFSDVPSCAYLLPPRFRTNFTYLSVSVDFLESQWRLLRRGFNVQTVVRAVRFILDWMSQG